MAQVSVVVTVKDEETSILELLRSLENQSLKPQQVIIVDGGSTDGTVKVVKSFTESHSSFKLIQAHGANRSKGRNLGISATNAEIIACTDAGVMLDGHWLENLVKPLINGDADFVGGVYIQSGEDLLQKCIGILQYPNPQKLRAEDFLPSSRSVAFKKTVWKTVGGYPEYLEKAEDTYFDLLVRNEGFRVALARDAVVLWPARKSLRELFGQYSSYAEWDARAKLCLRLKIYRFMILAYVFLAFSVFLAIRFGFLGFLPPFLIVLAYLGLAGVKAFKRTGIFLSFFLAMAIKVTIFSAETFGLLKGLTSRIQRQKVTI
jgi:glycosyltransferase involved in cell wall biosynthesis